MTGEEQAILTAFRRRLHERPELSGEEAETAAAVGAFLAPTRPDRVIGGLGGHGVAFVYEGAAPGPTVLFRCELDGLPIVDASGAPHASRIIGKGHQCGHDGHMAMLAGLGCELGRRRPARGRAVLLYQPAEENGAGAAAVIRDEQFKAIRPDLAFAIHNMPGLPLGWAALKTGPVNCASCGMIARLTGKTAHASQPERGLSPGPALARLIPGLTALAPPAPPLGVEIGPEFTLATVVHARLGEPAFGVAPGAGEVWATLRALRNERMAELRAAAESLARGVAAEAGLGCEIAYQDVFHGCDNHPEAVAVLARALAAGGMGHDARGLPMRASEDFGLFSAHCPSAMVLLGSGEKAPALHNPDFDFPDALIPVGAGLFIRATRDLLG